MMKKYIYTFFVILLAACQTSIFSQYGVRGPRYLGNRAADPASCSASVGTLYYDTAAKKFKFCSATNIWSVLAGGSGVASSTDNAVAKFAGTTGALANSGVIIDASNNVSGIAGLTTTGNVNVGNALGAGSAGIYLPSTGAYQAIVDTTASGIIRTRDGSSALPAGFILRDTLSLKTGAFTIPVLESNYFYTNEGATALVVFTLPTATAGQRYTFYVQDADGIRVTAAAGDTIRVNTAVGAAAGNATSTTIGSFITLVAINATEWVAIPFGGTWTVV